MKELGHEDRVLDYLKVDTDKGDGTGFEDLVSRAWQLSVFKKRL